MIGIVAGTLVGLVSCNGASDGGTFLVVFTLILDFIKNFQYGTYTTFLVI